MPDWQEVALGAVRWLVHPAWRNVLFDSRGLRLAEWQAQGAVETVKAAPHRTICRVALGAGSVYLKHYPLPDLRAVVRQMLRPAKARGEFDRALAVAARAVPTVEPLAVGETTRGESFLVTRGLDDTQPLNEFLEQTLPALPPAERTAVRFLLADTLADLLARMHDAGVRHRDLHAGNLLVQWRRACRPRLYLIDLHAVRLGGPLTWAESCANLVILNRWFSQRSSRADRRRFWQRYVRLRRGWHLSRADERARARELEAKTRASSLRFWRRRDRRCLETNRYFYTLRGPTGRAWAVRDVPPDLLRRLLADPDAPFAAPAARVLKSSRSSTVVEVELPLGDRPRTVICKRFFATKWSDPWLHLVRATPALRSWVNGHRLIERGLPTARPLAVIHRRRCGLTRECYLITEQLPAAMELHRHVVCLAALDPPARRAKLWPLVEQVARLVRELHARQLAHRDLKAANLLVGPAGEGVALYLIDLVGLECWRRLPRSRRVQNLSRLHASFHDHPAISRTDKLRFLRAYLAWGLTGKAGWKAWWRAVVRGTARKIARNRARGRPLA
jgi:tRNA A-37 threonylcarbamoyl transferase component Bud32